MSSAVILATRSWRSGVRDGGWRTTAIQGSFLGRADEHRRPTSYRCGSAGRVVPRCAPSIVIKTNKKHISLRHGHNVLSDMYAFFTGVLIAANNCS
jgi:hypothetical protein